MECKCHILKFVNHAGRANTVSQFCGLRVCVWRFMYLEGNILVLCLFCFKLQLENSAYLINCECTRPIIIYVPEFSTIKYTSVERHSEFHLKLFDESVTIQSHRVASLFWYIPTYRHHTSSSWWWWCCCIIIIIFIMCTYIHTYTHIHTYIHTYIHALYVLMTTHLIRHRYNFTKPILFCTHNQPVYTFSLSISWVLAFFSSLWSVLG